MGDRKDKSQLNELDRRDHLVTSKSTSPTVPVVAEQVHVDKNVIESGKVTISKKVQHEEAMLDLPTMQEEVNVERVPVNEYVKDELPQVRYEGDTMIIPIFREVAVVEKRTILVEELHVTKKELHKVNKYPVTLRREVVEVQHSKADSPDIKP